MERKGRREGGVHTHSCTGFEAETTLCRKVNTGNGRREVKRVRGINSEIIRKIETGIFNPYSKMSVMTVTHQHRKWGKCRRSRGCRSIVRNLFRPLQKYICMSIADESNKKMETKSLSITAYQCGHVLILKEELEENKGRATKSLEFIYTFTEKVEVSNKIQLPAKIADMLVLHENLQDSATFKAKQITLVTSPSFLHNVNNTMPTFIKHH